MAIVILVALNKSQLEHMLSYSHASALPTFIVDTHSRSLQHHIPSAAGDVYVSCGESERVPHLISQHNVVEEVSLVL